jgi:CheY-like chemotaxis protein
LERSLTGIRILVVDDQDDARDLLSTVLEQSGAEVRAVSSSAEAREVFPNFRPDVLVSDIAMPREGGYELIRKIRSLGADKGGTVPAVAVTAYATAEDRALAFAAGYDVHLAKPLAPMTLVEALAKLVRKRRETKPEKAEK